MQQKEWRKTGFSGGFSVKLMEEVFDINSTVFFVKHTGKRR